MSPIKNLSLLVFAIFAILAAASCKPTPASENPVSKNPEKIQSNNLQTKSDPSCGLFLSDSSFPVVQNTSELMIENLRVNEVTGDDSTGKIEVSFDTDFFADRFEWKACDGTQNCVEGFSSLSRFELNPALLPTGKLEFSLAACVRNERAGAGGLRCGVPEIKPYMNHLIPEAPSDNPTAKEQSLYGYVWWFDDLSKKLIRTATQENRNQPEYAPFLKFLEHNVALGVDRQVALIQLGFYKDLKEQFTKMQQESEGLKLADTPCVAQVSEPQGEETPTSSSSTFTGMNENTTSVSVSKGDQQTLSEPPKNTFLTVSLMSQKKKLDLKIELNATYAKIDSVIFDKDNQPVDEGHFDVLKRRNEAKSEDSFEGEFGNVRPDSVGVKSIEVVKKGEDFWVSAKTACTQGGACTWAQAKAAIGDGSSSLLESMQTASAQNLSQNAANKNLFTKDLNLFFSLMGGLMMGAGAKKGWDIFRSYQVEGEVIEQIKKIQQPSAVKGKFEKFWNQHADVIGRNTELRQAVGELKEGTPVGDITQLSKSKFKYRQALAPTGLLLAGAVIITLSNLGTQGTFSLVGSEFKTKLQTFLKDTQPILKRIELLAQKLEEQSDH